MYGNNFFMPYGMGYQMPSTIGFEALNKGVGNIASTAGKTGLFSKLTGATKSINWGNFLNNTSKTLNVINQAIPVVKQAGPMFNNMRSMLKIASVFKEETRQQDIKKDTSTSSNISYNNTTNYSNNSTNDSTPNFFIN